MQFYNASYNTFAGSHGSYKKSFRKIKFQYTMHRRLYIYTTERRSQG